jgi:pentatricopeptide repeat protein
MKYYKSMLMKCNYCVMLIGVICFLETLLTGVIGVVRGYSMQGYWHFFGLACIVCIGYCMFLSQYRRSIMSYAFFAMAMYCLVIGLPQGHYLAEGKEYYEKGMFQEALGEFEKETQTWYLRLKYNLDERIAMTMMARTYCQLKKYDKAREIYELIISRYPGFYAEQAKEQIDKLSLFENNN